MNTAAPHINRNAGPAGVPVPGPVLLVGNPNAGKTTLFNQITGLSGNGIVVGIADTGLGDGTTPNAGHADYAGRVIGGMSYDAGAWDDRHGHGTHCAGLIVANGYAGTGVTYAGYGPYYAGMGLAYDADIYAQKIFGNTASWIGPTDRGMILVDGYAGGARIHSNSWGASTYGAYNLCDVQYDTRVRDADPNTPGNQQILAIVAAGNDGSGTNTIGSPGLSLIHISEPTRPY